MFPSLQKKKKELIVLWSLVTGAEELEKVRCPGNIHHFGAEVSSDVADYAIRGKTSLCLLVHFLILPHC